MPIINQHREEIPVERDQVNMKPGERYCRVFQKLHEEQDLLKKVGINWDDLQKFTQAAEKIYSTLLFSGEKMINWEEKVDTNKMWAN